MITIPVWYQLTIIAAQSYGYWQAGTGWAWGWLLGVVGNLSWVIFALLTHQYILLVGAFLYGVIFVRNWRKNRVSNRMDSS